MCKSNYRKPLQNPLHTCIRILGSKNHVEKLRDKLDDSHTRQQNPPDPNPKDKWMTEMKLLLPVPSQLCSLPLRLHGELIG